MVTDKIMNRIKEERALMQEEYKRKENGQDMWLEEVES